MAIETLGAALRQINRLFSGGTVAGFSDAQLLERFVSGRDDAAFEALVARHGPMVLSVCRGVLHDPNDAEDAFQATFLVLVKKAGTFRGRVALGGWLYLVAHRVAIRANVAASRRRAYERRAGMMAAARSASGPAARDERLRALHEEIARLPEKFRLAILLCDLQGVPQDQAAGQLRLSGRTLRRRLSEGRERLKARLDRRGPASDGATLGALLLREGGMVVPPAWRETTVRAALAYSESMVATGVVSAAAATLSREVLKIMMLQKLKLASAVLLGAGFLTWGASAALIAPAENPSDDPRSTPVARPTERPRAPQPDTDPLDSVGMFPVHGRVVDPDGKPVAGAEIYVHHYSFDVMAAATGNTVPANQSGRVAVSDADGGFRFELDKAASDFPYRDFPVWHGAEIAAVVPGFGPAWITAGSLLKGGEATLRLVRDDVPIRGRVLDSQGRPVAGVTVSAREIRDVDAGVDKEALLASGAIDFARTATQYNGPTWLGERGTWTTDADGRFEIRGGGRDRIVGLELRSPTLEKVYLYAMARESQAPPTPRPRATRTAMRSGLPPAPPLVGATFEQIAGPTKPITGLVRLKGAGKPLAGVHVLGVERATGTEVSALTDAQGRFLLVGLPKAGSYEVRVAPRSGIDPFLGTTVTATDTEGLKPIETDLAVPKGVIVTGRLVDTSTGRPVRAKHVTYTKVPGNLNEGDGDLSTSGQVDPTFRITVPAGEGLLSANVRGVDHPYTRARLRPADKGKGIGGLGDGEPLTIPLNASHSYRMIDVPADAESFRAELHLTRGDSRKGKLVGPDGNPVVGAQCAGQSDAWADAKILADETFEVFGLSAGHPRLMVFGHEERRLVGWIMIRDGDLESDVPLSVRLERAGSIKGRLVDEDGLPLAGATFSVQPHYPDGQNLASSRQGLWPDEVTSTSDAEGRFQVVGLKPGLKSSIHVQSERLPAMRLDSGEILRNLTVQPGETRDVGDVKVKSEPQ